MACPPALWPDRATRPSSGGNILKTNFEPAEEGAAPLRTRTRTSTAHKALWKRGTNEGAVSEQSETSTARGWTSALAAPHLLFWRVEVVRYVARVLHSERQRALARRGLRSYEDVANRVLPHDVAHEREARVVHIIHGDVWRCH